MRSSCQLVRVSVVVSIIVCYNYTVLELKMLVSDASHDRNNYNYNYTIVRNVTNPKVAVIMLLHA